MPSDKCRPRYHLTRSSEVQAAAYAITIASLASREHALALQILNAGHDIGCCPRALCRAGSNLAGSPVAATSRLAARDPKS